MRVLLISLILVSGCSVIGREAEGSYPPVVSSVATQEPRQTGNKIDATVTASTKPDPDKGDDPIVGDWTTDPNVESVVGDWGSNGGLAPE